MKLYVLKTGQVLGPFSEEEVRGQLKSGLISRTDSYAPEGAAGWKSLTEFSTEIPPVPSAPVPVPAVPAPAPVHHPNPYAISAPSRGNSISSLAIGALVAGILSFACGLGSIAAVILGHLALSEIKRYPAMKGRAMALIGLVLGYLVLGLSLIAGIFYVFLHPLVPHLIMPFTSH